MGKSKCIFIFQKKYECGEEWARKYMILHKGFKPNYKNIYGEIKMSSFKKNVDNVMRNGQDMNMIKKKSNSIAKRIMEKSKCIYFHPPKKMPMW
jgi:hypothetical protein